MFHCVTNTSQLFHRDSCRAGIFKLTRSPGIDSDSVSLCSLASRFLARIDCSKIPALFAMLLEVIKFLSMNVPLILNRGGGYSVYYTGKHIIGDFEGFFQGTKTFLTLKLS
jgi:hypothetical protein